jgi:menaquinone-dependent protoporphyrinogen oxidase
MRILIVFGSTDGHTAALAAFAAGVLREAGHTATTRPARRNGDADDLDLEAYDAVIVAASLHLGRYQPDARAFVRAHHRRLGAMPAALISVSLSAAGDNPEDWAGLMRCLTRFERETGWTAQAVHHAAGAIRYSRYGPLKRFVIRRIAASRGLATVTTRDYDLTDYSALRRFLLDFAAARNASQPPRPRAEEPARLTCINAPTDPSPTHRFTDREHEASPCR